MEPRLVSNEELLDLETRGGFDQIKSISSLDKTVTHIDNMSEVTNAIGALVTQLNSQHEQMLDTMDNLVKAVLESSSQEAPQVNVAAPDFSDLVKSVQNLIAVGNKPTEPTSLEESKTESPRETELSEARVEAPRKYTVKRDHKGLISEVIVGDIEYE